MDFFYNNDEFKIFERDFVKNELIPILFDSIIISAAAKKVPLKLLKTLKTKGKIIFPKKYFPGQQKLLLLKKLNERNYSTQELFDVSFVPLL